MPRFTRISWTCGLCRHTNPGNPASCGKCGLSQITKNAQVHSSERAVVYVNPATGERRTPARSDQGMPATYAAQGFERQEIMNMTAFEKATGVVHEASNYLPGNENAGLTDPVLPKPPAAVTEALVRDFAAAMASGPMTDSDNSPSSFAVAPSISKR